MKRTNNVCQDRPERKDEREIQLKTTTTTTKDIHRAGIGHTLTLYSEPIAVVFLKSVKVNKQRSFVFHNSSFLRPSKSE